MNNKETKRDYYGSRPTLRAMAFQHAIVFLVCVVFPGLVTTMAPASWITFECSQEKVSCTARTCVFFIVPLKTQHVDQVTEISDREIAGGTKRERKHGRDTGKKVHVDGEGFLRILGLEDQYAEVSVSPASLNAVVIKAQEFLNSKKEGSTTLFAIANWKFGGLMGGVLTLLTVLYVVGYTLGAVKLVLGMIRKIISGNAKPV